MKYKNISYAKFEKGEVVTLVSKNSKFKTVVLKGKSGEYSMQNVTLKKHFEEVTEDEKSKKQVPASSKNKSKEKKKGGTKKMASKKKISWDALVTQMTDYNHAHMQKALNSGNMEKYSKEEWKPIEAVVVISENSFPEELEESARTYTVSSDNFGFFDWDRKGRIYADLVGGTDKDWVEIDKMIQKKGWVVEYAYLK